MSILHLCNTFFEWELADQIPPSLKGAFEKSPIFLQLQFLPLLYADSNDALLVTEKPKGLFSHPFYLFEEHPPFFSLQTWGYSKLVKNWADQREIPYLMPPWDVVKMVNSKSYSFSKSPLPNATLLYQGDSIPSSFVLKSCFGTAGRGLIFSDDPKAKDFCLEQWKKDLPIIAEPFVERKIDFSTQWNLSQKGEIFFLGSTICKTTQKGVHQSNIVGHLEKNLLGFIEEQKAFVQPILKEMKDLGYFGEVGIDAMVYNKNLLQPVVEINARKTMGWVALQVQKKHLSKTLELAFLPSSEPSPLPKQLGNIKFSRQITIL